MAEALEKFLSAIEEMFRRFLNFLDSIGIDLDVDKFFEI